ncbi:hypothetical protein [Nocardiopsis tropica]|uniref:Uncharacterized protein n=1 Tax=Nocardiopsis tropica TaxID=109330 RepID=A0ABU7L211_9ACTN|nr:hypothetical protein [Nocardiopsis umidischolae]MEE2042383.1 hypothetical protein [Nocardiopsis tropica]MEE2055599.1 hypothetical protein [Nocardiopsis umidischolae]
MGFFGAHWGYVDTDEAEYGELTPREQQWLHEIEQKQQQDTTGSGER